ncbi:UvrD-helicase domain-containing protein [Pseudoneobacillus sp. C159]
MDDSIQNLRIAFLKDVDKDLGILFTEAQREAIVDLLDKNVKIDAGAGGGKSTVITMMGIVAIQFGLKPSQLGFVTFTNKAAFDLKAKISTIAKRTFPDRKGLDEITVQTFHSFAFELLTQLYPSYKGWRLYDSAQMKILVTKYSAKTGWSGMNQTRKEMGMTSQCTVDNFLSIMGILRESEVQEQYVQDYILTTYRTFRDFLKTGKIMDFSEVLKIFSEKLENDQDFRKKLKERYRIIFADEFQDVNFLQHTILTQLRDLGIRIIAVGDGNQNIYSWRGSDNTFIDEFCEDFQAKRHLLGENFRSSEGIVDFSKDIIKKNIDVMPLQKQLAAKEFLKIIRSKAKYKFEFGDISFDSFQHCLEEAHFIGNRIELLLSKGVPPSEIAILLRKKKFANILIGVLRERNILVEVGDLSNLFATDEISAVKGTFYFLAGKHIKQDLRVNRLELTALWSALPLQINSRRLEEAIDFLEKNGVDTENYDYRIQSVYQEFLKIMGVEDELPRTKTEESIIYNLVKFTKVIHDFEDVYLRNGGNTSIVRFCYFINRDAESVYQEGIDQFQRKSANSVLLTTIHQSKGLEFLAVFIPMLTDGEFPALREYFQTPWHLLSNDAIVNAERYRPSIESERRLFYVGASRSKKFLFLSMSHSYQPAGSAHKPKDLSVFGQFTTNHPLVVSSTEVVTEHLNRFQYVGEGIHDNDRLVVKVTALEDIYQCSNRTRLTQQMGLYQPINRFMGYGESIHNIKHELHELMKQGKKITQPVLNRLVVQNLNLPYISAAGETFKQFVKKAKKETRQYYEEIKNRFTSIEAVEKPIESLLDEKILLTGRVDLSTRREITVGGTVHSLNYLTDIKTRKSKSFISPSEIQVFREQLYTYAFVYKHSYGFHVDRLEVLNIGENGVEIVLHEIVSEKYMNEIGKKVVDRIEAIQTQLPKREFEKGKCQSCHVNYFCLDKIKKEEYQIPFFPSV